MSKAPATETALDLPLSVSYTPSEADIAAWYEYRMFGTPQRRRVMLGYFLLAEVAIGALAAAITLTSGISRNPKLMLAVGVPAVVLIVAPVLVLFARRFPKNLAASMSRLPNALAPVTVALEADGIRKRFAAGEDFIPWPTITGVFATGSHLFLAAPANTAHTIPLAAFASPAHAQDMIAAATRCWLAAAGGSSPRPTPTELDAELGPDRIEVGYQLAPGEIGDLVGYTWVCLLTGRAALRAVLLLSPVALAVEGWITYRLPGMLVGLAVVPVILLVTFLASRQRLVRAYGSLGGQQLWASPRGLHWHSSKFGSKAIAWAAVTAVRKTGSFIAVHEGLFPSLVVPLSAFPSPAEMDRFHARCLEWHGAAPAQAA